MMEEFYYSALRYWDGEIRIVIKMVLLDLDVTFQACFFLQVDGEFNITEYELSWTEGIEKEHLNKEDFRWMLEIVINKQKMRWMMRAK